jgi:steroid delta-isomerase-like uncharacterized protein
MQQSTLELIEKYYRAFNEGDMKKFFSLLDEHVIHDINQGGQQIGKVEFEKFMDHMSICYREKIRDLTIMSNRIGTRAAAEFIVDGEYLTTDQGLPEAKGQKYSLPAATFFEIQAGKIKRVTTYYNLKKWLEQVG